MTNYTAEATGTDTATLKRSRIKMTADQKKKILAGSLGNAVEYIDWAIYATLAPVFAPKFFPADDDVAAILSTLAIFAVGFVMRPIGGAVLGSFADKRGRKTGLALSILIMSLGGLAIAISPTYEQIGILAPTILLLARLAQGFAAGGEYATSSAYLMEAAAKGRRAFAGSFQQMSIAAGILAASGISFLITATLDEAALSSWGWRLGFAIAAVLGLVVLWYRTRVGDSDAFEALKETSGTANSPLRELFRGHGKAIFWVFVITAPIAVIHYIWIIYMPAFANSAFGLPLEQTLLSSTISTAVFIVLIPVCGNLSDKYGRKPSLIFSCVGSLILAYPAFQFAGTGFFPLLICQLIAVVFLAPYSANLATVMSEQFPAHIRSTGIGFAYATAAAIFGGTTPYVITAIASNGLLSMVWVYPATMAVIGIVGFSFMRETRSMDIT